MIDLDYTFFIQLLLFISLAILLKYILFDPYLRNLKRRDEILFGYRREAEEIRSKIDELLGQFDERIKDIREDARKDYEKIKCEGNLEGERILKEARQQMSEIIEKGRDDLIREKESVMLDVSKHINEISNQISERILKGRRGN